MSGHGLGHTGGTLDKMESIPGMRISVSNEHFIRQVNEIGIAIVGQTGLLVPADKKLYALRDVTGTVESLPLIASSIMSKKLASGSDSILLDVKFGKGAFMKTLDDARKLAKTMVSIGNNLGRDTRAILTDMDQPLGHAVGNALEVKEAIDTLKGHGPKDLVELCLEAGAIMLEQAGVYQNHDEAIKALKESLENGDAFNKLKEMIEWQGGDVSYIEHPEKFPLAKHIVEVKADKAGYVRRIDALMIGESAMRLGAGRAKIEDTIDMSAGIVLNKKIGDEVKKDETLCFVHTNIDEFDDILKDIKEAFIIDENEVKVPPIIHEYIK